MALHVKVCMKQNQLEKYQQLRSHLRDYKAYPGRIRLRRKVGRGRGDMGTWGHGVSGTRGRGDVGTWGRGDVGTWGLGDVGMLGREDSATHF